jgi:hypothetical protein
LRKLSRRGLHIYLQPIHAVEHQVDEALASNLHPEQNRRLQHAEEIYLADVLHYKSAQRHTKVLNLKKKAAASQELAPAPGAAAFVLLLEVVFEVPLLIKVAHQNVTPHQDSQEITYCLLVSLHGGAFFVLPSRNILPCNHCWYHRF